MSDVVEQVERALDAWEAAARAATPGAWKLWGMWVQADQDGTSNHDTAVDVAMTDMRDEAGRPRTFDAHHIALNDPAAVLRMVAGLRAVVALADKWIAADDLTQWGDHSRGFCGRELLTHLAAMFPAPPARDVATGGGGE